MKRPLGLFAVAVLLAASSAPPPAAAATDRVADLAGTWTCRGWLTPPASPAR
jgi:hypothetical protein